MTLRPEIAAQVDAVSTITRLNRNELLRRMLSWFILQPGPVRDWVLKVIEPPEPEAAAVVTAMLDKLVAEAEAAKRSLQERQKASG